MIELVLVIASGQRFFNYADHNGLRKWAWALIGAFCFYSGWFSMVHLIGPYTFESSVLDGFVNNYSGLHILISSVLSGSFSAVAGFIVMKKTRFLRIQHG